MNREQWSKLTDDERRIKVAELCGWTRIHLDSEWLSFDGDYTYEALVGVPAGCVWVGSGSYGEIPNYLHDLNAMHEAEEHGTYSGVLFGRQYARKVFEIVTADWNASNKGTELPTEPKDVGWHQWFMGMHAPRSISCRECHY